MTERTYRSKIRAIEAVPGGRPHLLGASWSWGSQNVAFQMGIRRFWFSAFKFRRVFRHLFWRFLVFVGHCGQKRLLR